MHAARLGARMHAYNGTACDQAGYMHACMHASRTCWHAVCVCTRPVGCGRTFACPLFKLLTAFWSANSSIGSRLTNFFSTSAYSLFCKIPNTERQSSLVYTGTRRVRGALAGNADRVLCMLARKLLCPASAPSIASEVSAACVSWLWCGGGPLISCTSTATGCRPLSRTASSMLPACNAVKPHSRSSAAASGSASLSAASICMPSAPVCATLMHAAASWSAAWLPNNSLQRCGRLRRSRGYDAVARLTGVRRRAVRADGRAALSSRECGRRRRPATADAPCMHQALPTVISVGASIQCPRRLAASSGPLHLAAAVTPHSET
eukprot:362322-Chlamydomonas_euryale.AAC.3